MLVNHSEQGIPIHFGSGSLVRCTGQTSSIFDSKRRNFDVSGIDIPEKNFYNEFGAIKK